MNLLFLDLGKDGLDLACGFDSAMEQIRLDDVFAAADRVEVLMLNLPGPTGKLEDCQIEVPIAVARLLHAGAWAAVSRPKLWPLTANPKANNKDHTD